MSQPLVLPETIVSMLANFAPVFTTPSFATFRQYVGALMLGEGRRTGLAIARASAEAKSPGVYARLCSRACWSADALLHALAKMVLDALPFPRDAQGRLVVWAALDDSVVAKTGKKMPGVAYHFHNDSADPAHVQPFLFGHCWVVLGLIWPTAGRALCFPLRAALYVRAKDCVPEDFEDKLTLALDLCKAVRWPEVVCLRILADGAFATKEFIIGVLKNGYHLITRLKHNADLRWPAPVVRKKTRGRPRRYGEKVDLAHYQETHRQTARVRIGAKSYLASFSTLDAIPRRVGQLCRIVIVDLRHHKRAVLLSTDLSLSAPQIIEAYAMRFAIELAFRDLKQRFGWGHYQVRSRQAIERHVALSFVAAGLMTWLLVRLDDSQTLGQLRRALQQASLLAWIICLMGKTDLQRKKQLRQQLPLLRHPLLQGMAEV